MASDGAFVIVWESNTQDGAANGVFGRRFDAAGTSLAAEFRANSYTPSDQSTAAVAMEANGDFVVVWSGGGDQDGSASGRLRAGASTSAGVAQATEFLVNSTTAESQSQPSIAINTVGDFVVAWQNYIGQDGSSYGVAARRFNSSGVAQGNDFVVNSFVTGAQSAVAVGIDSDRDFVVAWRSYGQDGSQNGVFARRFNSAGTRPRRRVPGQCSHPQLATLPGGRDGGEAALSSWRGRAWVRTAMATASSRGASAPRASPRPRSSSPIALPPTPQQFSAAAMKADGSFILVWQDSAAGCGHPRCVRSTVRRQRRRLGPRGPGRTPIRRARRTWPRGRHRWRREIRRRLGELPVRMRQVDGIFAQRFGESARRTRHRRRRRGRPAHRLDCSCCATPSASEGPR